MYEAALKTSSLIPYSPPKPDTQIVDPGVEYELFIPSAFKAATVITSSKFFVSSISTPVQDKICDSLSGAPPQGPLS